MGVFDTYIPARPLVCPIDGTPLVEWQGKDGPCALLVWHEGQREPADDWVDDEFRRPAAELPQFTLPDSFIIYCYDCPRHQPIRAHCAAVDGVWRETRLYWVESTFGPLAEALRAGRFGRRREFVLIDLRDQMRYIPAQARDWPRERLLAWLRVWGEVRRIETPLFTPKDNRDELYGFRSWVGLMTGFRLTPDGRMEIPGSPIAAWEEDETP